MSDRLILASASPRRIELLRRFGLDFQVIPSAAEELHDPAVAAEQLCLTNAARKSEQVAARHPASIVLGADTLVTLDGELFGKPRDREEAVTMLSKLSGRTHQVITGVCLMQLSHQRREGFSVVTEVTFKALARQSIEAYLDLVPVLDKAGSYGIQERGEMLVEKVRGSFSNVIGLPLERLAETLWRWEIITPAARDKIAGFQDSLDRRTEESCR